MEIQKILGYLLNTSARFIKRRMDENLLKYDITTSQWAVLKLLYGRGDMSQAQIAEALKSDRATMGSVILKLSEKNYIERIVDVKDRRSNIVRLLPASKTIVEELEDAAMEITDMALKGLSKEEKDNLFKALEQIISNLSGGDSNELEI